MIQLLLPMNDLTKAVRSGCALLAFLALGTMTSCGRDNQMSDYIQTVKSGINSLPWPKEMEALFGEGDHFITHYGFKPGPKEWTTEVFFGGRYTLSLKVDVDVDYKTQTIKTSVSTPKFYLFEVGSVQRGARGVEGADISNQWILDEAKWKKLVQAKGDWSVLEIPVKTNSPVQDFDEYVRGLRAPVVKIPH